MDVAVGVFPRRAPALAACRRAVRGSDVDRDPDDPELGLPRAMGTAPRLAARGRALTEESTLAIRQACTVAQSRAWSRSLPPAMNASWRRRASASARVEERRPFGWSAACRTVGSQLCASVVRVTRRPSAGFRPRDIGHTPRHRGAHSCCRRMGANTDRQTRPPMRPSDVTNTEHD